RPSSSSPPDTPTSEPTSERGCESMTGTSQPTTDADPGRRTAHRQRQERTLVADDPRLRTVDEHLAIVLAGIGSIDPIELTLLDAQGLLLAEDVRAEFPLPSFDNSAMDGYAVRAVDTRDATADEPV